MSKSSKWKKITIMLLSALLFVPLVIPQASANEDVIVKNVEARAKAILTVDGKEFKDLNSDGKLDKYEDWRLPVEARVQDLLGQMSTEEKAGLMLISSQFMQGGGFGTTKCPPEEGTLLCETDTWSETNMWAEPGDPNYLFDEPVLDASAATTGILDRNLRYFIIRDNPKADVLAQWTNELQEKAESSRLGIPVVMTSNPRNHINNNLAFGFAEASGVFSVWPGELGLAATRDAELVKQFGQIAAKEWRASGIQKGYMYMADIITDPIWGRTNGTFGESPELAADMIYAIVKGFQGDQLTSSSVSLTTKHFPGGGARDDGKDPHYLDGNFNPYPTEGSLLKYHIPPFKAAIEAGTTSIMPYYAYPNNEHSAPGQLGTDEPFEEVGFSYNKAIIGTLLRDQLGFKGYVNTDTGITTAMPWGVEDLTRAERVAYALKAGVNIFSGEADPQYIIQAIAAEPELIDYVDDSVRFLLTEMMKLGLFEDPYVDPENAVKVASNPESQKLADEAHRKSVVLLRNDEKLLPINNGQIKKVKLYVEVFTRNNAAGSSDALRKTIANYDKSIQVVDNLEEATHALVWVHPNNTTADPSIKLGPKTGIANVDRIVEIQKTVPTITAINMTNPWLIDEIEPNAAAVISTFGVKAEALVDVIRGKFNPTGKLPFTIPADEEAVANENGDIPGYEEDPSYVYKNKAGQEYWFGFGLSYNQGKAIGKPDHAGETGKPAHAEKSSKK
ncbi:beta-glucosidase [Neobacillus niacini]|uniref:glycoside hydrolase family 3 protein n=1 Tax=Neobacillus niacini TaxID=86668 RepID=UPI002854AF1B|nr:glycoside hydrolase family 3 N-terminal domain-containing protein [Neobacillus niacini]MDR7076865.1 beta-glucosidase [Neobacillus niacini]